jgi:PTH1 family peptidyl-tRNA hydrolase
VKIIVGLGNPGATYHRTRHNLGFRVVDRLSERYHIPIRQKRFKAFYGKGSIETIDALLVKPLTFMNLSGVAVKPILDFFKVGSECLIVIQDDLDLPFGKLRFKQRGGDGGHQGIRSIIESIGGSGFTRLKVGIGRPPVNGDPVDYVLSPFEDAESERLDDVVANAAEAIVSLLLEGMAIAMNRFQGKTNPPFQSP